MTIFDQTETFQREVIGAEKPPRPELLPNEELLRLNDQLWEECCEMGNGIAYKDLAEICDAACDIIFTAVQIPYRCGVDLRPIWDEVVRSNMAKRGGKFVDGKLQKPPGWTPPDVEGELIKQGWRK